MPRVATMWVVFRKEVRELLRDRRSLMVMFGVPLVIYPLLFMGIGTIAKNKADEQRNKVIHLAVENGGAAPELMRRLRESGGGTAGRFEIAEGGATDADLSSGKADAVLVVPAEAEHRLLRSMPAASQPGATTEPEEGTEPEDAPRAATGPATAATGGGPTFKIRLDRSRSTSDAVAGRLKGVLGDYEHWLLGERLASRHVPAEVLEPLHTTTVDIASQEQRLGRFLGQLLPLLLMITGMLGAFFPALSATTTERELGTLETLLVTPVTRVELLIAKGTLVLLCSLLTAGLNMASMSLVFLNIASTAGEQLGRVAINPASLALAYVATIPTLVLFSAVVMCVGMIARTYREANSFAMPVMMLPMAAMAIGIADPPTTPALLVTPVANTTVLLRDILTNRVTAGNIALAGCSNLLLAAAVISIIARLFTNEQLVNPAWEPVSLRTFGKRVRGGRPGARRPRWPTIDEALLLISVGLLVQFYGGPWLAKWLAAGRINAPELVASLQVAAFVVPTLLLAWIAHHPVRETLPMAPRRGGMPLWRSLPAAAALGLGLMPLAMAYGQLQSHLFPGAPSDSRDFVQRLVGETLRISAPLAVICFGMVPGACEELMFRGTVLSALRKAFNHHAAVWTTAVLFAAVHFDLAGMPVRTALGAVLGYVTLRSGSLIPAMLLHAAFNGSHVGLAAYYEGGSGATTQATLDLVPEGLRAGSGVWIGRLAVGVVLAGVGVLGLWEGKSLKPQMNADERR